MFPDLITPASDFEHQLGACVNAMSQEDAIGQILVPGTSGCSGARGCWSA